MSDAAPVLQEMDPKYHLVQFNGTLGHKSEYCGEPTPELDAVWDKWAYVKYASIPEKTFAKLGEETQKKLGVSMDMESARLTPEYGGGYIGFLEVSHHIHCLNLLRKGVHRDYYMQPEHTPIEFKDPPWVLKLHLAHCIEILRENIMCNADVGVIPHEWVNRIPDPFANFNTWHKCRDISSVEKWIHANEIPDAPNGAELPIPIGSKIYPRPP
ncbi:hypothetical protein MMC15_000657 [Xylographa vitiligo]|nr:hypothetical protein [Xylographa vitiligo]